MYLKISARFSYEDVTPDHRGLRASRYLFGGGGPVSFPSLCLAVIETIAVWYCKFTDTDQINDEIQALGRLLVDCRIGGVSDDR